MAATLKGRRAAERVELRAFNKRLETEEGRAPFASRIRKLREDYDISQYEAALHLGISQPSYRAMEENRARFRRRDLVTLAGLFYPKLGQEQALQRAFPTMEAV